MATEPERLENAILDLSGGDPFAHVYRASHAHRQTHGPACGLYPSDPLSMSLVSILIRATAPIRLLDVGGGMGYSALHLAAAAGPGAHVDTIEHDASHIPLAEQTIAAEGYTGRITVHHGESETVIPRLQGPYQFVYDDGWFMGEPQHLEPLVEKMASGALLAMANWFPLQDALLGQESEWRQVSPTWAEDIVSFARKIGAHPKLKIAYSLRPWLGLAVKAA